MTSTEWLAKQPQESDQKEIAELVARLVIEVCNYGGTDALVPSYHIKEYGLSKAREIISMLDAAGYRRSPAREQVEALENPYLVLRHPSPVNTSALGGFERCRQEVLALFGQEEEKDEPKAL